MICENCGNLAEDCECDKPDEMSLEAFAEAMGDDPTIYGYDGDAH